MPETVGNIDKQGYDAMLTNKGKVPVSMLSYDRPVFNGSGVNVSWTFASLKIPYITIIIISLNDQ